MHQEIEKLIDLALSDGQLTEKERNVILKKSAELGIDADEVEMTLDGRLHQLEASKPKQKEKVGIIKTCPACGAEKKSFTTNCFSCGHEYVNSNGVTAVDEFNNGLKRIAKTSKGAQFNCSACNSNNMVLRENVKECRCYKCNKNWIIHEDLYLDNYAKKIEYIESYNMPNDKEGLLNLLLHLISIQTPKRFDIEEDPDLGVRKAARGKIIQSLEIAKIMFADDQILKEQLILIEHKVKKLDKIENWSKNSITLFSLIVVISVLLYLGYNFNINDFNSISWKSWLASAGGIGFLFLILVKISKN
jgi:hypothetical protein